MTYTGQKQKQGIMLNITLNNIEYESFFSPKTVLRPEYKTLFDYQCFLM